MITLPNRQKENYYQQGYDDALEEILEIAESIDDTYIIEVIKRKLEL